MGHRECSRPTPMESCHFDTPASPPVDGLILPSDSSMAFLKGLASWHEILFGFGHLAQRSCAERFAGKSRLTQSEVARLNEKLVGKAVVDARAKRETLNHLKP